MKVVIYYLLTLISAVVIVNCWQEKKVKTPPTASKSTYSERYILEVKSKNGTECVVYRSFGIQCNFAKYNHDTKYGEHPYAEDE